MARRITPPSVQRTYDACVVGSQLGGAVAGALLEKRGFRVLHVDLERDESYYEDGNRLLPRSPSLLPSPRFLPAAELVLRELGLTSGAVHSLEPCVPDLQLLLPRHRVDLRHEVHARNVELRREWPADAERLEARFTELQRLFDGGTAFLKAFPPLPPTGFGERRAVSRALRLAASIPGEPSIDLERITPLGDEASHPLFRSMSLAARFLGNLDGPLAPLATVRLLGGLLRGLHRPAAGHDGLRETVRHGRAAKARSEGMEEQRHAPAERLEVDGGRVAGVRLAGSPSLFAARVFIGASDGAALARLLPADKGGRKVSQALAGVAPTRQLVAVNLVVNRAALPPPLGDTVLAVRDPDGGGDLDNAVLMQVSHARRAGKGASEPAHDDERVVCAAGFVRAEELSQAEGRLSAARRLREAVAGAIPFFERHLLHESVPPPFAQDGDGGLSAPHPLYEVRLPGTLGVTGLAWRSPLHNLLLASREVLPGLGVEGELHAGVQAAAAATEMLGKT